MLLSLEAADLMHGTPAPGPFSREGWIFEVKYLCAPSRVLRFIVRLVAGLCVSRCVSSRGPCCF